MTTPVPTVKPKFIKPTLDTPYHIDFEWWNKTERDLRVYLKSHLCDLHREMYADPSVDDKMDWVDAQTAEVTRIDGILYQLRVHCSQQPEYITEATSLVDAVLRVFLVNDNQPLSPRTLGERIGKDADLILKTISGKTVYKGLRPATAERGGD
jgi:hypothetical protein